MTYGVVRRIATCGSVSLLLLGLGFPEVDAESTDGCVSTLSSLELIQAPREFRSDRIRQGVVVLRFWSTWCSPCVADLPAYNRAVREASEGGDAILFVAISTERAEAIGAFLRQRPMEGIVAADNGGVVASACGVRIYPTTIVLRDGRVVATVAPGELPLPALRAAMKSGRFHDLDSDVGAPAVFAASMREYVPAADGSVDSSLAIEGAGFEARAAAVSTLIEQAYDVRAPHLVWNTAEPRGRYDVSIETSGTVPFAWKRVLQEILKGTLGFATRVETRTVVAYDLGIDAKALAPTAHRDSRITRRPGEIDATAIDVRGLALTLEEELGATVQPRCGPETRFDLRVHWDPADSQSLLLSLKALGVHLRKRMAQEKRLIIDSPGCGESSAAESTPRRLETVPPSM